MSVYPSGGGVSDRAAAYVRTYWPWVLGHVATLLAAMVARRFGVEVSEAWLYEVVALAASAGVYALGRWLEGRAGQGPAPRLARTVGRFVLSLGLHTGTPTYAGRHAR